MINFKRYTTYIKQVIREERKLLMAGINKMGFRKQCYVCKSKFFYFLPFKLYKEKDIYYMINLFDMVGSDIKNYSCPNCGVSDRLRHLYMYFDKLEIWKEFRNKKILHIAPEKKLCNDIVKQNPNEYILGDINTTKYENFILEVEEINITNIQYNDNYFDVVICNHVLEHVQDYELALNEFYRILKKNGFAVLQTPFSKLLKNNFSDQAINSDELREKFYGQNNHVRIFGMEFFDKMQDIGFKLDIKKHKKLFQNHEAYKYGVNEEENLILVRK